MEPDEQFDGVMRTLGQALMQTQELLGPVLESAEGIKADMVGRGWTEANAETVALSYLQGVLPKVIKAVI